ncbi:MAG: cytochrome c biogenesis protein CcsA [Myxococcales bacterium]|nr:MAG: cytochrome c biogenesis protein CcsA [Myxococcales bacterium]
MGIYFLSIVILSLYCAIMLLYLAAFLRGFEPAAAHARTLLTITLALHTVAFFLDLKDLGYMALDARGAMMFGSWVIGLAYLAGTAKKKDLRGLGLIVTPLVLTLFVVAQLVRTEGSRHVALSAALRTFHVAISVIGVAAFVLAFSVSVAYLIQEYLLRTKRLGVMFKWLPDLQVLESLDSWLVTLGFPLLTLGIFTGALWNYRINHVLFDFGKGQVFAILAWFVFFGMLLLRGLAGWRGRRTAWGTIVGFVFSMIALASYTIQAPGLLQ